ncbi:hypothetical protein ACPWML_16825 [Pandoraea pneumonica]
MFKYPLSKYLLPGIAADCYSRVRANGASDNESVELNDDEMVVVQSACKDIVSIVPEWRLAFAIPLCWRRLTIDILSSSNPLIPQHIFLGKSALESPRLSEYIVHEISHIWVGMFAEITPLADPDEPIHVLPSGTSGKDTRQVMYALTFAVTAVRFYRARVNREINNADDDSRLQYLERYALGCLDIAESSGKLTPDGVAAVASCRRYLFSSG